MLVRKGKQVHPSYLWEASGSQVGELGLSSKGTETGAGSKPGETQKGEAVMGWPP